MSLQCFRGDQLQPNPDGSGSSSPRRARPDGDGGGPRAPVDARLAARAASRADGLARPLARRRDEDVLSAARVSRRARGQRADDPGASAHRLGPGRSSLGHRDDRLHAGHRRHERASAPRPHQRPRGHRWRREDGQEDCLPRQARVAASAESARPRSARRRTAQPLVRPRHGRRPARRHERTGHEHLRPARRQRRAQRQQPALGARQLDAHLGNRRLPAREEWDVRGAQDAVARTVGRVAGRRRPYLPQLERVGAARRSGSRRPTSRETRACCERGAATNPCAARTTK